MIEKIKRMDIDELIKEAFKDRLIYERLGIPAKTWHSYKHRFKDGNLSHEKKQEILQKLGYKLLKQEQWVR